MRQKLIAALAAMLVAGLLAGCSSGSLPPPPITGTPEATTPPSGATQTPVPTAAPEHENPLPADTDQIQEDTPNHTGDEEPVPPPSDGERIIGPSTGLYTARTDDGVDVVYFETTNACACMIEVGDAVEAAILTYFQEELRSGELRFFMLFSNSPGNMDMVKTLKVQPFDLFIGGFQDGQGSLEPDYGIWSLTGNHEAIVEYVRTLVTGSLEGRR